MTGTAEFDLSTEPRTGAERQRTYSWSDPVATATAVASMSGMEALQEMAEGRIPYPPIGVTMDFDGFFFEEGRASFQVTPQEFHYNPIGAVHGGVFATLLDSACGCAVHTMLPVGVFYTSLDLSVKFLRPVLTTTGPITAEGTVVHLGRRTALAEGRITDAAGKLYATATSSILVMRPE